jgi:hypothetical protein
MKRAITSALAAAALTLAIAVPALADPPRVLVDIIVTCQSADGAVEGRVPDGPPGETRRAIAEWFRTNDCQPGTKDLSFGTRAVTFGSICLGLGGDYNAYPSGATCDFVAPTWTDFRHAWSVFASHCRGQILWAWDNGDGSSWVACTVK